MYAESWVSLVNKVTVFKIVKWLLYTEHKRLFSPGSFTVWAKKSVYTQHTGIA